MTIAPAFWPRRFPLATTTAEMRVFEVEPGERVLARCHWQEPRDQHPTLIVLHGLEGSSEAHYVLGVTEKALHFGFNVIRMNMRNCGATEHLSRTLYNAGMSGDLISVIRELRQRDRLPTFFLAGYSLGGNLVLKAAADLADSGSELLSGVSAVSPPLDLALCIDELEKNHNQVYQLRFLLGLKAKLRRKHRLFPDRFDIGKLRQIHSVREFDDCYTAPDGGYGNAENYYRSASALPVLERIRVPALIIQAQDDPFVPFRSFRSEKLRTPYLTLLTPLHGGHAGFIQQSIESSLELDRFWAENRIVTFAAAIARAAG